MHLDWNRADLLNACDFLLTVMLEVAPPEIAELDEVLSALLDLSNLELLSCWSWIS